MRGRRRGEGSPPYGGLQEVRRGRRADVGIGPYGWVTRGAAQAYGGVRAPRPTEALQKARLVVACRIRIHTHIRYIHPKPKPPDVFWQLMDELYKAHSDLKECAKYEPSALNLCAEIEQLVLDLQEVI